MRRIQHCETFAVFTKTLVTKQAEQVYPDVDFRVAVAADERLLKGHTLLWEESQGLPGASSRLKAGDLAVLGVASGDPTEVLYISWVTREDKLFCMCADSSESVPQACSRRIWVPAQHRRRRLAERGLLFAENAAFDAGVRRLWAFALRDNEASIRLHEKLGYRQTGFLRIGRRLGKRIAQMQRSGTRHWQDLRAERALGVPQ